MPDQPDLPDAFYNCECEDDCYAHADMFIGFTDDPPSAGGVTTLPDNVESWELHSDGSTAGNTWLSGWKKLAAAQELEYKVTAVNVDDGSCILSTCTANIKVELRMRNLNLDSSTPNGANRLLRLCDCDNCEVDENGELQGRPTGSGKFEIATIDPDAGWDEAWELLVGVDECGTLRVMTVIVEDKNGVPVEEGGKKLVVQLHAYCTCCDQPPA